MPNRSFYLRLQAQLRSLFTTVLVYGLVIDPKSLQIRFYGSLYDNLPRILAQQPDIPNYTDIYLNYGLFLIQRILINYRKTLIDYSLPQFQYTQDRTRDNTLLAAKLTYDPAKEGRLRDKSRRQLNANQATYFNTIITAIDTDPQNA